ncbi:MAG: DUF3343 domain-containing protein [Treponema sp.]|jgi:hypothetical protein|nr:DUF3343 domain-containing protein [Treponema sp.]
MKQLFTFETVSAALDAEILCKELNIPCRIIPVPRFLSASCGYAMSAESTDAAALSAELRRRGALFVKVFRCKVLPGKGESYEPLAVPDTPDGAGQS